MGLIIEDAEKICQYARVCFWGVEKQGKTHAALELATALANGDKNKIGVISSERGSSSLLAPKFPHRVINLAVDEGRNEVKNPFSAKRYEEALQLFVDAGCEVIIVDSLTHLWEGEGGILNVVAAQGGEYQKGWDVGTPLYQKFLNKMLSVPCHLIVTLRAKDAYEMEDYTKKDGKPGKRPANVGVAPIIRKGFGFEMQFAFRMNNQVCIAQSSAYQDEIAKDMEIESITNDFYPVLVRWLEGAPLPERIPTLQESYKRGLAKGAWVKETFYQTASRALGVAVARDTALDVAQLKALAALAALAEQGAPMEDTQLTTEQPEMPHTVTDAQWASIGRIYQRMGRTDLPARESHSYNSAKELIAILSQEYRAMHAQSA